MYPSIWIIKYIAVFTPEPWQGYGYYDDFLKILRQGNIRGREKEKGSKMNTLWLVAKLDIKESLRAKWLYVYSIVFDGLIALFFLAGFFLFIYRLLS